MIFLIIYIFCVIVALGTGLLAAWSDFSGMTIPNHLSLVIAGLFFLAFGAAYLGQADIFAGIKSHLISGIIIFVSTFIMFFLRLIGGGDSKLLTAYALWAGLQGLVDLVFYMAFIGAFLGLAALLIKKTKPFKNAPEQSWVGRLQGGQNAVPYGIPIVTGAFISFLNMGYLQPQNLGLFLQ